MSEDVKVPNIRARIRCVASEGQTDFSFSFPIFADHNLNVFEGPELKKLNEDYFVSIDLQNSSGIVKFYAGRTQNTVITIVRNLVIERKTDFHSTQLFNSEPLNSEFNFQVAALQDLVAEQNRSVRLATFDVDADLLLPPREARAGKLAGFDANGGLTVTDPGTLGGGGGDNQPAASNHGGLSGLINDDHPHYHTDARGDARYYTRSQVDTALGGKAAGGHSHDSTYAAAGHVGDTGNPHAVNKEQVGLGNVLNLKVNLAAADSPSRFADADAGYAVGSRWVSTTSNSEWVCVDATPSTAVWKETTLSGAVDPVVGWGSIGGTLSNQADLQNALDAKFTTPPGVSGGEVDSAARLSLQAQTSSGELQDFKNSAGVMVGSVNTDANEQLQIIVYEKTSGAVMTALTGDLGLILGTFTDPPGAPPAGLVTVYAKSDGELYFKNDQGSEKQVSEVRKSTAQGQKLNGAVQLWHGTEAEYAAIATKDPNTIYFQRSA